MGSLTISLGGLLLLGIEYARHYYFFARVGGPALSDRSNEFSVPRSGGGTRHQNASSGAAFFPQMRSRPLLQPKSQRPKIPSPRSSCYPSTATTIFRAAMMTDHDRKMLEMYRAFTEANVASIGKILEGTTKVCCESAERQTAVITDKHLAFLEKIYNDADLSTPRHAPTPPPAPPVTLGPDYDYNNNDDYVTFYEEELAAAKEELEQYGEFLLATQETHGKSLEGIMDKYGNCVKELAALVETARKDTNTDYKEKQEKVASARRNLWHHRRAAAGAAPGFGELGSIPEE
jgi:hypothetical protein